MYCQDCGAKAAGNFCSSCGARLRSSEKPAPTPLMLEPLEVLPAEWEDEVRYDVLLKVPEVRDQVTRHAAQARKRMSGEQFLELCDKLFSPLGPVPLAKVATLVAPVLVRAGIRTGKKRQQDLARRTGEVLVAALCSLARHGQTLKQVHQGDDGCVLEAAIPSDIWSLEGELVLSVQRRRQRTHVEAVTRIQGQLFDWGKSTRCLNQLFEDLVSLPTSPVGR